MAVTDIVAVIDMDGYVIESKFYCKELGLIKIGNIEAKSFFFDIHRHWDELSRKDKRTCSFVRDKIHRLPFGVSQATEAFPISELTDIIENFYNTVRVSPNSLIAYKGGHYEKDLLRKLNIPSVNLERFGCPKANKLFHKLDWMQTCGNHLSFYAYEHCAKVEVEAFAMWMKDSL